MRILVLDDDALFRAHVKGIIQDDFELTLASTLKEASDLIFKKRFDFFLLDRHLGEEESLSIVPLIRAHQPHAGIIIITCDFDESVVEKYINAGATDYLFKTNHFDIELRSRLKVATLRSQLEKRLIKAESLVNTKIDSPIIGGSNVMNELRQAIETFSTHEKINVLITGESGTGKELIARAIHKGLKDPSRPFVIVNCGAVQKELINSELFGHVKGAFTGAVSDKTGKIELANGGDLFLDEIGELSLDVQASLLRCLNHGGFEKVGSNSGEVYSKFRLISATNKDLEDLVRQGKFREDLYYRIRGIEIHAPPLRDRGDDVIEIANYILKTETGSRLRLSKEAVIELKKYSWPGNVRELKSSIQRGIALCMSRGGVEIKPTDLFYERNRTKYKTINLSEITKEAKSISNYKDAILNFEKLYLEEALIKSDFSISKAAQMIQMPTPTFYKKIRELSISTKHRFNPSIKEIGHEKGF